MSFATLAALTVGLFIGLPVAAHLLRRRHAEERPFPPTALLAASPPTARKRSRIEDRALLAVRALAVLALAVLGATPFVSCSRLALERKGGASVALAVVVDDSLSMRASAGAVDASRGARARDAALDLVRGARPGDAIALVLAGSPPRVALAPTTDLDAALQAVEGITPTDRATDLDGAVQLARDLVARMPQPDRRVVLLSDLQDGTGGPPLEGSAEVPLWFPLPDLRKGPTGNCAILGASRTSARAEIQVACGKDDGDPSPSAGRAITILREGTRTEVTRLTLPAALEVATYTLDLPPVADDTSLVAALDGTDAIADDDRAPLAPAGAELAIGVVSDPSVSRVETGGPPPIEQGFTALGLGATAKALTTTPDEDRDLAPLGALIVDDPPGFTPEQRRALSSWIEAGGTLLVTLGPTSDTAPLGSSFAGLIPGVVRWTSSPVEGAEPRTAVAFGGTAQGLADLAPRGRANLEPAALEGAERLADWQDGAPLLIRRRLGRGSVLALTLPLSTGQSDIALRPAFLALLDRVAELGRAANGTARVEVGQAVALDGYAKVAAAFLPTDGGAPQPVRVRGEGSSARLEPDLAGRYRVQLDEATNVRIATVPARELDPRVRKVNDAAQAHELGGEVPAVDASPWVALGLLALFAAETALRVLSSRRREPIEQAT